MKWLTFAGMAGAIFPPMRASEPSRPHLSARPRARSWSEAGRRDGPFGSGQWGLAKVASFASVALVASVVSVAFRVTSALGALTCVASLGGCSEVVPSVNEDDEIPLSELAKTLSLPALKSVRAYEAFATEGGGFGQSGRVMKYFADVRSGGKSAYFINSNYAVDGKVPPYAQYHYDFAQHELGIVEDPATFNGNTYYNDEKRYIAGSIQTYTLGGETVPTYAIQFYPDDVIHEEGILRAVEVLRPRITIKNVRLAVVATGPQQTFDRVKDRLRALGVEPMTIDQVLGSVKYLPLNAGEAWGYLRVFPKDYGTLRPTDIPVFDELPLDLSVVAGTITRAYQDVTSHVNLKSKERGTPNMVLRDASAEHPELSAFADKPVHLVVGKAGYRIEATTAEIVEAKLRERTNKPWVTLPVTNERDLRSYDAMCPSLSPACVHDGGRFGGKAAGLGFLASPTVLGRFAQPDSHSRRLGYDLAPFGFGVPVQRYRDFLAENPIVRAKVDALAAAEKAGGLSTNDRAALSTDLQKAFYSGRVPEAELAEVVSEVGKLAVRFPSMDELKFRSSANAEDIPSFDGAGLHDSFSVKLSARDNPDFSCAIEVDTTEVVTKLKIRPKTPQCAIKAVYASLWNTRAIEERSFARLDHASSAMGLAVVPAYDTESDVVANGVIITRNVNGAGTVAYTLSLQQGNELVTNPSPGTIAQMTLVTFSADPARPDRYTIVRPAIPTPYGAPLVGSVLPDAKMAEIVSIARAVETAYCAVSPGYSVGPCGNVHYDSKKPVALDMEFKVLANGHVVLKQSREFHGR